MNRQCPNCSNSFRGGDKVRAIIITEWIELKSKVVYALDRPIECLEVVHRNCNAPQTEIIGEDA